MWNVMRAEKLTNNLFGSGSKEDSITSRRCWTSGTTQRASLYMVRADDGNLYVLRQQTSTPDGMWDLVSFRQNTDTSETTGAGRSTSAGHRAQGSERR